MQLIPRSLPSERKDSPQGNMMFKMKLSLFGLDSAIFNMDWALNGEAPASEEAPSTIVTANGLFTVTSIAPSFPFVFVLGHFLGNRITFLFVFDHFQEPDNISIRIRSWNNNSLTSAPCRPQIRICAHHCEDISLSHLPFPPSQQCTKIQCTKIRDMKSNLVKNLLMLEREVLSIRRE